MNTVLQAVLFDWPYLGLVLAAVLVAVLLREARRLPGRARAEKAAAPERSRPPWVAGTSCRRPADGTSRGRLADGDAGARTGAGGDVDCAAGAGLEAGTGAATGVRWPGASWRSSA